MNDTPQFFNRMHAVRIAAAAVFCIASVSYPKGQTMTMTVTSPAFGHLAMIPKKHTCDGPDVSPPLSWTAVPKNAKSIVLICDDPDAPAGDWVHWICYDIPSSVDTLADNMPKADTLKCGGKQGKNDFGRIGWGGPCPPGGIHRYFFKLYALDTMLNLAPGTTKKDIEAAMKGHVIGQGELVGKYSRTR